MRFFLVSNRGRVVGLLSLDLKWGRGRQGRERGREGGRDGGTEGSGGMVNLGQTAAWLKQDSGDRRNMAAKSDFLAFDSNLKKYC